MDNIVSLNEFKKQQEKKSVQQTLDELINICNVEQSDLQEGDWVAFEFSHEFQEQKYSMIGFGSFISAIDTEEGNQFIGKVIILGCAFMEEEISKELAKEIPNVTGQFLPVPTCMLNKIGEEDIVEILRMITEQYKLNLGEEYQDFKEAKCETSIELD